MKINEYFKCRNLTCELHNVKGFDFTEFEETEIFDEIKSVLEMKSNWNTFGPVHVELRSTKIMSELLQDGKVYPAIHYVVCANHDGTFSRVDIVINPFGCSRVEGDAIYDEIARKKVSKAFAKFMSNKFGVEYISKRSVFLTTVKNLKIEQAKRYADEQIQQAKDEFKENMLHI